MEEFREKNFFTGELFVDAKQQCYKDMGFKRHNVLNVIGGMAAKETRNSLSKVNAMKISGNMKGDGMQNGGMVIVTAGGEKVLLSFKQKSPGDHFPNKDILELLGINEEKKEAETAAAVEGAGPAEDPSK